LDRRARLTVLPLEGKEECCSSEEVLKQRLIGEADLQSAVE
jgi:hypothetical protein